MRSKTHSTVSKRPAFRAQFPTPVRKVPYRARQARSTRRDGVGWASLPLLTCYGGEVRLPQSDLAYAGFRLAALDTLCQIEMARGQGDKDISGYLAEVPLLAKVAPAVQVDLLAGVWKRHLDAALHEASLLDAAVVFAAFQTAGRVIDDEPSLARSWVKSGPRRVRCRLGARAAARLRDLFFEFWDDIDFLSLEELQDLPPDRAGQIRDFMRLPDGAVEEMEGVLTRWRASLDVVTNLEGLLTNREIGAYADLLSGPGPKG